MKQFFLSPCPQARGLREGQMLLATLQPGKAFSVQDKQISGRLGEKRPHFASLPGSYLYVRSLLSSRDHLGNKVASFLMWKPFLWLL